MYRGMIFLVMSLTLWAKAGAEEVIEKSDRLSVNWSKNVVRFYGRATLSTEDGANAFRAAERKAWNEGIQSAKQIAQKFASSPQAGEAPKLALNGFSDSVYSVKTIYFANDEVVVELENILSRFLPKTEHASPEVDAQTTRNTGIILVVSGQLLPSGAYRVLTPNQQTLFSAKDVSAKAYSANLMGRWFVRPSGKELADAVGDNPVRIQAKMVGKDLVVDQEEWTRQTEGNQTLLKAAKIAIATF